MRPAHPTLHPRGTPLLLSRSRCTRIIIFDLEALRNLFRSNYHFIGHRLLLSTLLTVARSTHR